MGPTHFGAMWAVGVLLLCCTCFAGALHPIVVGNIRISVLSDRIVRLEHSSFRKFEDRPTLTFPFRSGEGEGEGGTGPSPSVTIVQDGNITVINTSALTINVSAADPEGSLTCASVNISYLNASDILWCPDMGTTTPNNLNGSVMTTDCYASADVCAKTYMQRMKAGLFSFEGYSIVDETTAAVLEDGWVANRAPQADYLDWVFVEGTDIKTTLNDFVRLAGRIPMLPSRAYNVWWSRWWPYNATGLAAVVDGFAERQLPLSMVVMDMDWHDAGAATLGCGPDHPRELGMCAYGYGGYVWNASLFADPAQFLSELHGRGLQVMTNQHDQCEVDHCQLNYAKFAERMGIDPATEAPVPCMFTNRNYVAALLDLVVKDDPNRNVDYAWEDYGLNGGIDGTVLGCVGDQHCMACLNDLALGASPMGENSPALWSAAVRVSSREQEGLRGMTLGVYGGLGHHRYGIVGSGDTHEAWVTLAYEVYASFTAANVLTAWTHDIGGFYPQGTAPQDPGWLHDPSLFLKWVQFGCFSSFFRPHASQGEVRPWIYPNAAQLEPYWRLRSALGPYIYSAAHKAYDTGLLLVRPMYHEYPSLEDAYKVSQWVWAGYPLQYIFGDDIFIAAMTASALSINAWFPPGRWVPLMSFHNSVVTGPMWGVFSCLSEAEFPVFARAGAVIPMRPLASQHEVAPSQLLFTIVETFDANGTARVVEDDGESLNYTQGMQRVITVVHECTDHLVTVTITPEGSYPGAPATRSYVLRFRGWQQQPTAVLINGQPARFTLGTTTGGALGDEDAFAHAAGGLTVPMLFVYAEEGSATMPVRCEVHY